MQKMGGRFAKSDHDFFNIKDNIGASSKDYNWGKANFSTQLAA